MEEIVKYVCSRKNPVYVSKHIPHSFLWQLLGTLLGPYMFLQIIASGPSETRQGTPCF